MWNVFLIWTKSIHADVLSPSVQSFLHGVNIDINSIQWCLFTRKHSNFPCAEATIIHCHSAIATANVTAPATTATTKYEIWTFHHWCSLAQIPEVNALDSIFLSAQMFHLVNRFVETIFFVYIFLYPRWHSWSQTLLSSTQFISPLPCVSRLFRTRVSRMR